MIYLNLRSVPDHSMSYFQIGTFFFFLRKSTFVTPCFSIYCAMFFLLGYLTHVFVSVSADLLGRLTALETSAVASGVSGKKACPAGMLLLVLGQHKEAVSKF